MHTRPRRGVSRPIVRSGDWNLRSESHVSGMHRRPRSYRSICPWRYRVCPGLLLLFLLPWYQCRLVCHGAFQRQIGTAGQTKVIWEIRVAEDYLKLACDSMWDVESLAYCLSTRCRRSQCRRPFCDRSTRHGNLHLRRWELLDLIALSRPVGMPS